MAQVINLTSEAERAHGVLTRALQSARLNFLLGSGASVPAIPIAGQIEQDVARLFAEHQDGEAYRALSRFLKSVQDSTNALIQKTHRPANEETAANYIRFVALVDAILSERRTRLLPKQATLFTTNYDLFVELACSRHKGVTLNDGFSRVPALDGRAEYSSRSFFNTVYNTGQVYDYRVEVPCINLIKLHGSLSWEKDEEAVTCSFAARGLIADDASTDEIAAYLQECAVILPGEQIPHVSHEQTYYDLFRIYANELDKENSLLISFGFSFGDDHILHVTKRALRNPTMLLMVFAFDANTRDAIAAKFASHNNVVVVTDEDRPIDFAAFNSVLTRCAPKAES